MLLKLNRRSGATAATMQSKPRIQGQDGQLRIPGAEAEDGNLHDHGAGQCWLGGAPASSGQSSSALALGVGGRDVPQV
jgi:hypothetical protein